MLAWTQVFMDWLTGDSVLVACAIIFALACFAIYWLKKE